MMLAKKAKQSYFLFETASNIYVRTTYNRMLICDGCCVTIPFLSFFFTFELPGVIKFSLETFRICMNWVEWSTKRENIEMSTKNAIVHMQPSFFPISINMENGLEIVVNIADSNIKRHTHTPTRNLWMCSVAQLAGHFHYSILCETFKQNAWALKHLHRLNKEKIEWTMNTRQRTVKLLMEKSVHEWVLHASHFNYYVHWRKSKISNRSCVCAFYTMSNVVFHQSNDDIKRGQWRRHITNYLEWIEWNWWRVNNNRIWRQRRWSVRRGWFMTKLIRNAIQSSFVRHTNCIS